MQNPNPSPTFRERLIEVYYKEFNVDGFVAVDTTFENVLSFFDSEWTRRDNLLREVFEGRKWESKASLFSRSSLVRRHNDDLDRILDTLLPSKDDLSKEI